MKPKEASLPIYLDVLTRELARLLPRAARKAQPEAIHRVRVTTRRLGSLTELLRPNSKQKGVVSPKTLKKLRRRLGKIRDLDVMLGRLRTFRQHHPAVVRWLGTAIQQDREKAAARLLRQKSLAKSRKKTSLSATAFRSRALPALSQTIRRGFRDFAQRADVLCRGASGENGSARVDVHALRISGKALRYGMEIATAAGASTDGKHQKALKQIQDLLGQWHDYVVLGQYAMKKASKCSLALENPALFRQMLSFLQKVSAIAQEQIDSFTVAWKQNRKQIRSAVTDVIDNISSRGRHDDLPGKTRKGAQRGKRSTPTAHFKRNSRNAPDGAVRKAAAPAAQKPLAQ